MVKLFMLAAALSAIFGIIAVSLNAIMKICDDIRKNEPMEDSRL